MKKLLLLLILSVFVISCSNDDNKGGGNFLTNIESVKNAIQGVWKSTVGGVQYTVYNLDGTTCNGLYQDRDWDTCTKYEILRLGSDYVIHNYHVGSDTEYSKWKIITLSEEVLEIKEIDGNRYFKDTRVK